MFARLIQKLRSWKRSCQRTQLELKQENELMERATGLHFYILKKPLPCTLAVARYSSWADIDDLHTRIFDSNQESKVFCAGRAVWVFSDTMATTAAIVLQTDRRDQS